MPVLKSHEEVETGFIVEVSKGDVALLALLRHEALVNEVQGGPAPEIGRPCSSAAVLEPVDGFKIQRDHVGNLTPFEVCIRPKVDITGEDRTHLGVNAEHDQLWIEGDSGS